jgi:hypothetical protein
MKTTLILAFVGLAAVGGHATAKERVAKCYLSVDGKAYLDQVCVFDPEKDGSFTIGTAGENGTVRMPFFAYVNKNDNGSAQGYWNEDASSTHAHTDLGVLKRKGGCWQNARAKVCAQ